MQAVAFNGVSHLTLQPNSFPNSITQNNKNLQTFCIFQFWLFLTINLHTRYSLPIHKRFLKLVTFLSPRLGARSILARPLPTKQLCTRVIIGLVYFLLVLVWMMTSSSTLCPVCPVCLEDIEDPVVLPCRHEVCKVCFCATVAVATVCCPLCRKRMSSWARKNARDPVNKFRKAEIERNRLEARVDSCTRAAIVPNCLSQPGDIKKEYLLELEKVIW